MRKVSLTLIAALSIFGLAALFAPASAQTDPLPESTIEPESLLILEADDQCALTPDESAAVISGDGVYNLPEGTLRFAFPQTEDEGLTSPQFIPDTTLLLVAKDGLYDFTTGTRVAVVDAYVHAYRSEENKLYLIPYGVFDLETNEMEVWEVSPAAQFPAGYPYYSSYQSSVSSLHIPYSSAAFYVVFVNGKTRVYNTDDGTLRFEAPMPPAPDVDNPANWQFMPGFKYDPADNTIHITFEASRAFSDETRQITISSAVSTFVYDATDGALIDQRGGWEGKLSPDGRLMARPDGVFNADTREHLFDYQGSGTDYIFSPDSSLLFHMGDGLYDTATGERVYETESPLIGFSPDSRWFSIFKTGIIDARTREVRVWLSAGSGVFSPSSRYIVWTSRSGCRIYHAPES